MEAKAKILTRTHAAAGWNIQVLGGFRARLGEMERRRMPPLERRLLTLLALSPVSEPIEKAHIAATLWPGLALEVALRRLATTLSALKRALTLDGSVHCAALRTTKSHVTLSDAGISIDVRSFLLQASCGNSQLAKNHYGGPLLPEDSTPWVAAQRERLQRLHESLVPESQPVLPHRTRRSMPVYDDVAIERRAERAALLAATSRSRITTIVGPGGCGKTRLVVEACELAREFDFVVFVPCEDTNAGDDLLDCVRSVRGLQARPRNLLQDLASDLEAFSRPLLVLDNVEQHVGSPSLDAVAGLLAALPHLHLWMTSREPTRLDGEVLVRVGPMALPPPDAAGDELEQAPAIRLFCERARERRKNFRLNGANAAFVQSICARLEGHPLAIEIAAAQVRDRTLRALAADTEQSLQFPRHVRLARKKPPRHRSLERTLEWSWDALNPELRSCLAVCATFKAGCSASQLAISAKIPEAAARMRLERLVDKCLLIGPADPSGRYRTYRTVAEFVLGRIDAAERETLQLQYLEEGVRKARESARTRQTLPEPDVVEVLHALTGTAAANAERAAELATGLSHHWFAAGIAPQALSVMTSIGASLHDPTPASCAYLCLLARVLVEGGAANEALRSAAKAIEFAGTDPGLRAQALLASASVQSRIRPDNSRLEQLCREALECAQVAGSPLLEARALVGWVPVRFERGDREAALACARRAAVIFRECGEEAGELEALACQIACELADEPSHGRLAAIWDLAEDSLRRARAIGHRQLQMLMYNRLGLCAEVQGRFERAWQVYREQGLQARMMGSEYHFAMALWNLALPLAHMGNAGSAARSMAFGVRNWSRRFGRLSAADQAHVQKVKNLVVSSVGRSAWAAAWAEGSKWSLAEGIRRCFSDPQQ